MVRLFNNAELDRDATADNVITLLKQFKILVLRGDMEVNYFRSQVIDGMPKSQSVFNTQDIPIVNKADVDYEVYMILKAIKRLDLTSRFILNNLFINDERMTNFQIQQELNCEKTKYFELKKDALVYFAEAYKGDDLKVYK